MAQVTLAVGGRRYDLACRDGEEPHLLALAALVDRKAEEAGRAVGNANETRQLLMAALMLADDLSELRAGEPDPGSAQLAAQIGRLAARIESLAERLEKDGDGS